MANSVNVADRLRLSEMKKDQSSDEQSLCQDFSSQLVLFKVFVGITSETKSAKMYAHVFRIAGILVFGGGGAIFLCFSTL